MNGSLRTLPSLKRAARMTHRWDIGTHPHRHSQRQKNKQDAIARLLPRPQRVGGRRGGAEFSGRAYLSVYLITMSIRRRNCLISFLFLGMALSLAGLPLFFGLGSSSSSSSFLRLFDLFFAFLRELLFTSSSSSSSMA